MRRVVIGLLVPSDGFENKMPKLADGIMGGFPGIRSQKQPHDPVRQANLCRCPGNDLVPS